MNEREDGVRLALMIGFAIFILILIIGMIGLALAGPDNTDHDQDLPYESQSV